MKLIDEAKKTARHSKDHIWIVALALCVILLAVSIIVPLLSSSDAPPVALSATATPVAATPTPYSTPRPTATPISQPSAEPTVFSGSYVKTAIIVDGEQVLVLASRQAAEELMRNVQLHYENLTEIPANSVTLLINELTLEDADEHAETTGYDECFDYLTGTSSPLTFESTASFTEETVVPHEVTVTEDDELPLGTRIVTAYGRDGLNLNSYTAKYINGIRIELIENESTVILEAVDGEIIIGTHEYDEDYTPDEDYGQFIPITESDITFMAPTEGDVIRLFGPYGNVFHHGVDIAAIEGTPVAASCRGTVVSVMERGDYGLMIEIDHGGGFTTRYAQLSGVIVSVGDSVSQGDIIGHTGIGGSSEAAHLHFEVRFRGYAYNPLFYID